MKHLVGTVFKIIIGFTVLMIVFVAALYLVTINSLNRKIEAVQYQISNLVGRNNYLTEDGKDVILDVFEDILDDYSVGTVTRSSNGVYISGVTGGGVLDNLVRGIQFNYSDDLDTGDTLATVKNNGELHHIRIQVYYKTLAFVNQTKLATGNYNGQDYETSTINVSRPITYDTSVVCFRYIK